ncbi:hypothetical protein BJ742DRAFT_736126 [Cladochytrium replicatum]|nr:hypothetical protein BJ742DRAFT_736126 [Cladochytrium replicatum]
MWTKQSSWKKKGDRYKDGQKAKRFYERACAMYEALTNCSITPITGHSWIIDNADNLYNLAQAKISKVNFMGDEENVWSNEFVSLLSEASSLLEKAVEIQRKELNVG